jgi:outer membrane protein assembly factor BamB
LNELHLESVKVGMAIQHRSPEAPLRLWPGVVIVALQWLARFVIPTFAPGFLLYGVMAGMAGGVAIGIWWLFFSRAPRFERVAAPVVLLFATAATWPLLDVSIATGAMGMAFFLLALPGICLAFVLGVVVSRRFPIGLRRATMAAAIVIACVCWTLVRTGGFTGDFDNDLAWRWTPTPEQRLLAQGDDTPAAVRAEAPDTTAPVPTQAAIPDAAPAVNEAPAGTPVASATAAEWPGFRGRDRNSIVNGVRIATDWSASPPKEMWRRAIGPGWSSFAVHGDLLYTQEQRGDDEIVAAYRVSTGAPVWKHRDAARFWESNGGAGPRGTPTLSNGRVYAFGATGILNVLDAADGRVVWSRNVAADSDRKVPDWGFSSSPLLVGDLVIIAAEGKLAAYDVASGAPRWFGPNGGLGYSSPQLTTIDGVPQVLLLNGGGATSVAPADGLKLWDQQWSGGAAAAPIVQPASMGDGDLLIADGQGGGIRRVAIVNGEGGWTVAERWKTTGLKPLFNDFVVHKGRAFGFDGSILACIDLADGQRCWKGGRYGSGQLVLLPDQDLLLVLSEDGDVALVAAVTDGFREIARFKAIDGKTWNHPVVVGDILLVRNGEEMAAFKLPVAPAR